MKCLNTGRFTVEHGVSDFMHQDDALQSIRQITINGDNLLSCFAKIKTLAGVGEVAHSFGKKNYFHGSTKPVRIVLINTHVRSITVRAFNLVPKLMQEQLNLFDDLVKRERRERMEDAIESIRNRFGKRAIYQAILMGDLKMPGRGVHEVTMPGVMYQ